MAGEIIAIASNFGLKGVILIYENADSREESKAFGLKKKVAT